MTDKKVVHIPSKLHQTLKIKAAKDRTTVGALVVTAVETMLKPVGKMAESTQPQA